MAPAADSEEERVNQSADSMEVVCGVETEWSGDNVPRKCYRSSAAPGRTPARLAATPPRGSPRGRILCAAAALLGIVDAGAEELAGVVTVLDPALELDAAELELEADAEVEDGTNNGRERDVCFVAAAQNCPTSASADLEGTSAGHAVSAPFQESRAEEREENTQRCDAEAVPRMADLSFPPSYFLHLETRFWLIEHASTW
ncbi:hypothetical protein FB451DRAFT_1187553 [Mycena latifolia]|nr:hypothetical protein FB451DRAFT_1187553 [Mycena latifolia]